MVSKSKHQFFKNRPSLFPFIYLTLTCRHVSFSHAVPLFTRLSPSTSRHCLPQHHAPPSAYSLYLHGNSVLNKHRSQLSIQLKEDLSLTGLVQVTQCQSLDVESLPSLKLHLRWKKRKATEREREENLNKCGVTQEEMEKEG